MENSGFTIVMVLVGVFSILGAAMDWDWFIESRKARLFLKLFGRTGCRIFYGCLGVVLIVYGLMMPLLQ